MDDDELLKVLEEFTTDEGLQAIVDLIDGVSGVGTGAGPGGDPSGTGNASGGRTGGGLPTGTNSASLGDLIGEFQSRIQDLDHQTLQIWLEQKRRELLDQQIIQAL